MRTAIQLRTFDHEGGQTKRSAYDKDSPQADLFLEKGRELLDLDLNPALIVGGRLHPGALHVLWPLRVVANVAPAAAKGADQE
jgi:hypothetical protein